MTGGRALLIIQQEHPNSNTNKNTFGNENKKAMLQIRHFLQRNNTDGAVHPGRHIQFGLQSECSPRPKQTEKGKR